MTPAKLLVIDAREGLRHIPRETLVDVSAARRSRRRERRRNVAGKPARARTSRAASRLKCGSPAAALCRRISPISPPSCSAPATFTRRTEDRPPPPSLVAGDALALGPLSATVTALLGHPRLVSLHFHGSADEIWAGIARHGRPIQYAHVPTPLALWDVWTPIASPPVAFEPPSAGFALDWQHDRGHARARHRIRDDHACRRHFVDGRSRSSTSGCRSTSRTTCPSSTRGAIARARASGGRIVAIGTTVVRALEHAGRSATAECVHAGRGIATQRIGPGTRLRVVDAILTGVHERGTSHYELLRAFADDTTLSAADEEMAAHGYRPHEFGDSVLVIPPSHDSRRAMMSNVEEIRPPLVRP